MLTQRIQALSAKTLKHLLLSIILGGCAMSPTVQATYITRTPFQPGESIVPTATMVPTPEPTPTPLPEYVHATYHSGQTFVTWDERSDLNGEVYRVYRTSQPIVDSDLSKAARLAEVGKNSAAFYTDRYNSGSEGWKVRYLDRLVIPGQGSPVSKGKGLLVWTLAAEDFGGSSTGDGYYAVTVTPPGGQEVLIPGYVTGPVAEAVADPQPVEITGITPVDIGTGGHIFIQYMNLRSWNATFHAPNPENAYYGLDPADPNLPYALQYAYDYTVFEPTLAVCKGVFPAAWPVLVHLHGWAGNTYSAPGGYPDAYCAYGIYPIDVSETWYFGFAEKTDYRKGGAVQAGDVIENFTEQRLLRMIYDLEQNPFGPPVDPQRVYVAGQSMGGTGTLALAERYPNVFAAAYASQPMTDFRTSGVTRQDWVANVSIKWGGPDLNLPVKISAPANWSDALQKYNGTGVWDWQDLQASASGMGKGRLRAEEMAPVTVVHGASDDVIGWASQVQPLYGDFNEGHRAWSGLITRDKHQWEYYLGLPPSMAPIGGDNKYKWVPFWGLTMVRDETVPGLSNLTVDSQLPPAGAAHYNQTVKWSSSWSAWDNAPVDQPAHWQMSLCSASIYSQVCGGGRAQTVDVTPRRVQHFQIVPGATYDWQNYSVKTNEVVAEGTVTADADGLITVKDFEITPSGNRLSIVPHITQ